MPVTLTIKNVPDALAASLRERAARNHRSLQGELMYILESLAVAQSARTAQSSALESPQAVYALHDVQAKYMPEFRAQNNALPPRLANILGNAPEDDLYEQLRAIMGDGLDTTSLPSREELHQRESWKRNGI